MTPQARSVAAFTLAVLLLTGHLNRVAAAVYVVSGGQLPSGDGGRLVLGLLTVLVAAGVLWFAHTAVVDGRAGWENSAAQAGRFLAAIGLVVAVLATISVLTNNQPYYGVFSG